MIDEDERALAEYASMGDPGEESLLLDMFDALMEQHPADTGPRLVARVGTRRGRRYRLPVSQTRLYVPAPADHYEADWCGFGDNLSAGETFARRYVHECGEYLDDVGQKWSGGELRERFGLVIGRYAWEAVASYLADAVKAETVSTRQVIRLAEHYHVPRGKQALILGDRVGVRVVRRAGSNAKALVIVERGGGRHEDQRRAATDPV